MNSDLGIHKNVIASFDKFKFLGGGAATDSNNRLYMVFGEMGGF
jgi:hypothetical protein